MQNKLEKIVGLKILDRSFTAEEIANSNYDFLQLDDQTVHLLLNEQSITAQVIKIDLDRKLIVLNIEGVRYELKIETELDSLIHELGFDQIKLVDEKEVKAPMPGLVLEVLVKVGQKVSAGDDLIILEAMKMENVLQAPNDGVIKSIEVKTTNSVEKNQILINFK